MSSAPQGVRTSILRIETRSPKAFSAFSVGMLVVATLFFTGSGVASRLDAQTSRPTPPPGDRSTDDQDSTPAPVTYPEEWVEWIETLRTGTLPEKGDAIDELLSLEDAAVLPLMREALGEPDRDLRVRITSGILRTFPQLSADFFFELFDDPSVPRREAALFAVGTLDDPRTLPRLLELIDAAQPELAEAATRSLLNRGKQGVNASYSRSTGGRNPRAAKIVALYHETARKVCEHLLATGRQGSMRALLWKKFAGAEAARRARASFAAASTEDQASGDSAPRAIVELGERVATWSPRPTLPGEGTLSYSIDIQNVFAKTNKTVSISVNPEDFRALQYWSYFLDRVVRLELPLDHLLLDPAICDPRWIAGEETNTIRYLLPERTGFQVGVGVLNIAYWSGTIQAARDVELVVDAKTGFPRSEVVKNADGIVQMRVEYLEPIELKSGSWAPGAIQVKMPNATIGNRVFAMRFEFRFAVTEGVWHLSGGETYVSRGTESVADSGVPAPGEEELRAIAVVENARWLPRAGEGSSEGGDSKSGGTKISEPKSADSSAEGDSTPPAKRTAGD